MSDNEKETQVAEETLNTQAAAEATNEDRKSRRGQRGEGRARLLRVPALSPAVQSAPSWNALASPTS